MYFLIEILRNKTRKKTYFTAKKATKELLFNMEESNFTKKDISTVETSILSSVETSTVIIISVTWFDTRLKASNGLVK